MQSSHRSLILLCSTLLTATGLIISVVLLDASPILAANALDYTGNLDSTASSAGLPTENQKPTDYVIRGIQVFMSVLGLIALILIIYGGVLMLTSAGNDERISEGKKIIMWAAIGILVILSSVGIVQFIGAALGS